MKGSKVVAITAEVPEVFISREDSQGTRVRQYRPGKSSYLLLCLVANRLVKDGEAEICLGRGPGL